MIAFDTGPGNMVIDALAQQLFNKPFDRNGAIAARGAVLQPVLRTALRHPYFRQQPPRTAGREQFGREYAAEFLASCRRISRKPEDAIATATALTAETIARSYRAIRSPCHEESSGGLHRFRRRRAQRNVDGHAWPAA